MDLIDYTKLTLLFLLLTISMSANLDDNLIARLGISGGFAPVILASLVTTLLLSGRPLMLTGLVLLLSLNANMPTEFVLNFGVDRDYYTGLLAALVLTPTLVRIIDW